MQAEPLIADTHLVGFEVDVLQNRRVGEGQREILLNQSWFFFRADNLFIAQSGKANKAALVHNPLELLGRFEELAGGILVPYLLGDDMPTAEGREVALLPAAVLGCLGQEQVAGVIQERSLVEVSLETAGEETHILLLQVRMVTLLDKPVLLVHDTVGRQYLDRLYPSRMDGSILRTCHRIEFGQVHPKGDRDVGVLREDAPLFDGKQREAVFQRGGFQYVSHCLSSFPLFVLLFSLLFRFGSSLCRNRRGMRRRLMRYRGWLCKAERFISPCSPYFLFREKVCHTRMDAEVPPKPIQIH